jgi:hypothetical protein
MIFVFHQLVTLFKAFCFIDRVKIDTTRHHIKSQSNYWRRGFTIYTADPALHNIMSQLAPKAIIGKAGECQRDRTL